MSLDFSLNDYQDDFVFSDARFCCLIAGIGTGKTLALLLKAWVHCEQNSGALALIIRKEFTDLRDSTIQDFQRYFNVSVGSQSKEYAFDNGSKIMFRHGNEVDLSVLKNINLSFIGIEQAEEYDNDTVFHFLRDRLRRQDVSVRQFAVIANAHGQNWLWKLWVNNADTVDELDAETGIYRYTHDEYYCLTATTFANQHNLPDDFIADLRRMETEAPNHYKQYVLNSFDIVDDDDILLTSDEINKAVRQEFLYDAHKYGSKILGVDIARYGDDKCIACVLEQVGPQHFKQQTFDAWQHHDLMYTTGKIMDLRSQHSPLITVVDGDGLGAGVVDRLRENGVDVVEYRGGSVVESKKDQYVNKIAADSFYLKELISQNRLSFLPDVMGEAQTIRYYFDSKGRRGILSKEKMRAQGLKSPDHWDALRMAVSEIDNIGTAYINREQFQMPRYYAESNPYGGMR